MMALPTEKTIMKRRNEDHQEEHHHLEETVQLVFRGLIPIVLLAGGLFLLDLRIFGWSLFFGLPTTVAGVALLIFTYDEVMGKRIGEIPPRFVESKTVNCFICGRKTLRALGEWEEDAICPKCKSLKEGKNKRKRKKKRKGK